jgi:hypothetical protein
MAQVDEIEGVGAGYEAYLPRSAEAWPQTFPDKYFQPAIRA